MTGKGPGKEIKGGKWQIKKGQGNLKNQCI